MRSGRSRERSGSVVALALSFALAVPTSALAAPPQPEDAATDDLPASDEQRPRGRAMAATGFTLLAGSHIATLATAAALGATPEVQRPLFVPVIGPFVAIGYVRAPVHEDPNLVEALTNGVAEVGASAQRVGLAAAGTMQLGFLVLGVLGSVTLGKSSKGPRLSSGAGGLRLDF